MSSLFKLIRPLRPARWASAVPRCRPRVAGVAAADPRVPDAATAPLSDQRLPRSAARFRGGRQLVVTGGARSVWEVSAARALRRLQREEHGLIYTDGHGRVRLEASTLRSGIRANSDPASLARATVGDAAGGASPYSSNLRWDDGVSATEDAVVFRYRRLADEGTQRVWSLNEPPGHRRR